MAERKAHASELKRTLRALSAAQHAAATSTAQRNNCEGQIITLKQANASLNKQLAVAKTHNHSTRDKTPTAVRLAKAETHIATLQREKDAATEQLAARDAELRKLEQMSSVASEMGHTFKARLADTQKQLEQATLLLKATQADLQAAHARNEETLMNGAFALIKREGEVASIKEQWEAVLKSMEDTEAVCEALRKEVSTFLYTHTRAHECTCNHQRMCMHGMLDLGCALSGAKTVLTLCVCLCACVCLHRTSSFGPRCSTSVGPSPPPSLAPPSRLHVFRVMTTQACWHLFHRCIAEGRQPYPAPSSHPLATQAMTIQARWHRSRRWVAWRRPSHSCHQKEGGQCSARICLWWHLSSAEWGGAVG